MGSLDDRQLMESVREGDLGCLASLCCRHVSALFLHLTGNRETSQDLVQDTLLRVLQHRAGYRGSGPFRVWLFRVARSAANAHFRKSTREEPLNLDEVDEPRQDPCKSPVESLERKQSAQRLRQALGKLSVEQREVLVLRRFEDLDYREIAQLCGTTPGAVRVRFHRALQALAKAYRGMTAPEPRWARPRLTLGWRMRPFQGQEGNLARPAIVYPPVGLSDCIHTTSRNWRADAGQQF